MDVGDRAESAKDAGPEKNSFKNALIVSVERFSMFIFKRLWKFNYVHGTFADCWTRFSHR